MELNEQKNTFSAAEEKASVPFSNLTKKIIFDYSFTAKLVLSDDSVKHFYAEIATELLKYEGVKPRTLWSGVAFFVGRERMAFVSITDKDLCVHISEPGLGGDDSVSSLHVIIDAESQNDALLAINSAARKMGLEMKDEPDLGITAESFSTESFSGLVAKGLIKIFKNGGGESGRTDLYGDTVDTQDMLIGRHGAYDDIFALFSQGDGRARLSQKLMLRSVDEIWVRAIEDCISSLDELIRNPNHFIAETEDILPIEKTKRISGRSISHLCRHTDYISVKENGDITPTKMLNVFREDSLLTYENKFLNTLINRLYLFVSRRYKVAVEYGADEKLECFELENSFAHDGGRGKVRISVEYSERNLNSDVKRSLLTTGLWSRVERLNDIVTGYVNSPFAKAMDRNFVRPPIMRTNAIIKNKYFRECLALWEFIESYDDAGYGITVDEKTRELSDEYIKAAYSGAAIQYMLFKHHTENGFDDEESEREYVIPKLNVTEGRRTLFTEDMILKKPDEELSGDLDTILRVAIEADRLYDEYVAQYAEEEACKSDAVEEVDTAEQETDADAEKPVEYDKESFAAICKELTKYGRENFVEICHSFLRYDGMRMIYKHHCARFMYGAQSVAVMTFSGKSMRLYVSLPYDEIPKKFNAIREFGKRASDYAPSYIKIKSRRTLEYAGALAEMLAYRCMSVGAYDAQYEEDGSSVAYVSLGTSRKLQAGVLSDTVRKLAVTEPDKLIATDAKIPDKTASEDARHIAAEISGLIRPSGNYERPTEYGIDDASEFMKDVADDKKSSRAKSHDENIK